MFSRNTILFPRIPVALFNTKHFQSRHKAALSPSTFTELFGGALSPKDRLLRQSKAGAGASRVLILDRVQQVKGVYHPLLCLPHPSVIASEEESTLGLPVEKFMAALEPKAPEGKKRGKAVHPHVMTLISHPNGIGYAVFSGDGSYVVNLKNFAIARSEKEQETAATASSQDAPAAPTDEVVDAVKPLLKILADSYTKSIAPCTTFYYVVRDNKASITLPTLEKISELVKDEISLPFSFADKRWVTMTDVVFHGAKGISVYTQNASDVEEVDAKGLKEAVSHGSVELDYVPKKKGEDEEADAKKKE